MATYSITFSRHCLLSTAEIKVIVSLMLKEFKTRAKRQCVKKSSFPVQDGDSGFVWHLDEYGDFEDSIRNCMLVEIDSLKWAIRKAGITYLFAESDIDVSVITAK